MGVLYNIHESLTSLISAALWLTYKVFSANMVKACKVKPLQNNDFGTHFKEIMLWAPGGYFPLFSLIQWPAIYNQSKLETN